MSVVTFTIDPASLVAAGPLAVKLMGNTTQAVPADIAAKLIVTVGKNTDFRSVGDAEMGSIDHPELVNGALNITTSVSSFATDVQLNRLGQVAKNSLASLITRGIIIVTIGGAPQTAVQILSLPET